MCFIWNEQVFIRFLFFLTQEGLHITGSKRLAFFWNRGLYVLELIPPRREKFVFSCVAFCDTLRLSRNIRVPHFNFFLPFFFFFFYLWSNKRRCCDEVHKAIMAINFTSRHGFSSFPNKKQSKKVNKKREWRHRGWRHKNKNCVYYYYYYCWAD